MTLGSLMAQNMNSGVTSLMDLGASPQFQGVAAGLP